MRLKVKNSYAWARKNRKVPLDVILAFDVPAAIDQVFLNGPYRLRITAEITRDQFMERLRKNLQDPTCVAAQTTGIGNRFDRDTLQNAEEPDPTMRYFYTAEVI